MRELKNRNQSFVAEHLGMTLGSYSKLENGQTEITLTKIEQSGGNAILADNVSTGEAKDELIATLKDEVQFLRKKLETKLQTPISFSSNDVEK